MPYIAIKAYPKDEETKKKVVEEINRIFLEYWGCPQSAVSISMESVEPDKWEKEVHAKEILADADRMMILDGVKMYE